MVEMADIYKVCFVPLGSVNILLYVFNICERSEDDILSVTPFNNINATTQF